MILRFYDFTRNLGHFERKVDTISRVEARRQSIATRDNGFCWEAFCFIDRRDCCPKFCLALGQAMGPIVICVWYWSSFGSGAFSQKERLPM